MSFASLLIQACTVERWTDGGQDAYGQPVKTWADHIVDEPCRISYPKGRQVQRGTEVVPVEAVLFVDDIDAAVAKNAKGVFDYSACWAIVSAAIELSQDIHNLKCVVSVRSDIWHLMTRVQGHGAERKDKLGQIHELKFSEEELREIFKKNGVSEKNIDNYLFGGDVSNG